MPLLPTDHLNKKFIDDIKNSISHLDLINIYTTVTHNNWKNKLYQG